MGDHVSLSTVADGMSATESQDMERADIAYVAGSDWNNFRTEFIGYRPSLMTMVSERGIITAKPISAGHPDMYSSSCLSNEDDSEQDIIVSSENPIIAFLFVFIWLCELF